MGCNCSEIRRDLAAAIRKGALTEAASAASRGVGEMAKQIKLAAPAITKALSGRR